MLALKRCWTQDEDELLRDLAGKISPQRICVRMSRSISAVLDRARRLNIELRHKPVLRRHRRSKTSSPSAPLGGRPDLS